MNKKFYEKTWFIVLILILFFPIGLVLVWTNKHWTKKGKIIATVIVAVILLFGLFGGGGNDTTTTSTTVDTTVETTVDTTIETTAETTSEATVETTIESSTETTSETIAENSISQNTESSVLYSPEELASLMDVTLYSFKEHNVTYDEESNMFTITVSQDGTAAALYLIKQGLSPRDDWDNVLDKMANLNTTFCEFVEQQGSDAYVSLYVVNDENSENVLAAFTEGVLIYDCLNE